MVENPQNNPIRQFVVQLLIEAKLTDAQSQADPSYIDSLTQELEKKLGLLVMRELMDEDMLEYGKLISSGAAVNPEVSLNFFRTRIPDFDKKRDQWLEDFARDFLKRNATLQQALNT